MASRVELGQNWGSLGGPGALAGEPWSGPEGLFGPDQQSVANGSDGLDHQARGLESALVVYERTA